MRFSKMHGLGNDFMVVETITQNVSFSKDKIRHLSDRHIGVGFDQLLVIGETKQLNTDFQYRIFNADGQEVYQCGNGVRCLARFVYMKKLTNKSIIRVITKTRRMILSIIDHEVSVNMGEPIFDPEKVPFVVKELNNSYYIIHAADQEVICWVVSMGNPHCVLIVKDIQVAEVSILGPILENHFCFPEKTNVSFMEIVNCKHIRLRVHERGVGETKSCGSAACAAVSVGIREGLLSNCVLVDLLGGSLVIDWEGVGNALYMRGEAIHVYDGCL